MDYTCNQRSPLGLACASRAGGSRLEAPSIPREETSLSSPASPTPPPPPAEAPERKKFVAQDARGSTRRGQAAGVWKWEKKTWKVMRSTWDWFPHRLSVSAGSFIHLPLTSCFLSAAPMLTSLSVARLAATSCFLCSGGSKRQSAAVSLWGSQSTKILQVNSN